MLKLSGIDKTWTLFLDRDGVINHEKERDYVYNYDEFIFYDRVHEAMNIFNDVFGKIIVVTNQRGVGKGLMSEETLSEIHDEMSNDITSSGGRIDGIYYCTATDNKHPDRKPNQGMAIKAMEDFPEIKMAKSIMVGNNLSDMEFGRNAGMYTILLKTTIPTPPLPNSLIDLAFEDLFDFASCLKQA
ncbi:MAG TPA: HAD-IIIA family hydrolase [Flavitalea sp.]|nr:HAD-IIIA family hydrolase [Flavitalea sp.]